MNASVPLRPAGNARLLILHNAYLRTVSNFQKVLDSEPPKVSETNLRCCMLPDTCLSVPIIIQGREREKLVAQQPFWNRTLFTPAPTISSKQCELEQTNQM